VGSTFRAGDRVRVTGVPPSISALPAESQAVFRAAVGRTFRVAEVVADSGDLVLNLHADGSQADDWCAHTIWLEPGFAVPVTDADEKLVSNEEPNPGT
jgi:hypothetical protein